MDNPNHRIYMLSEPLENGIRVLGFLKVGNKNLFALDEMGRHLQISPLCVLDFYVSESCQRKGLGKRIFDFMLASESGILEGPHKLAYDRPSIKLQSFLYKHFNLSKQVPQANRFLIFQEFGLNEIRQELFRKLHTPGKRRTIARLDPIMPYRPFRMEGEDILPGARIEARPQVRAQEAQVIPMIQAELIATDTAMVPNVMMEAVTTHVEKVPILPVMPRAYCYPKKCERYNLRNYSDIFGSEFSTRKRLPRIA